MPSTCNLSYHTITYIFVVFNLLDFLLHLSYLVHVCQFGLICFVYGVWCRLFTFIDVAGLSPLHSHLKGGYLDSLFVLRPSGSSKCQMERLSSAPNPPSDNDQGPGPLSCWQKLSLKIRKSLWTTAAKPLICVLLQKPIISTISSVSSLIFGPKPHLLCLQQVYGSDQESKAATKTMKTRRGRRYQSSFSNNWCNACEKARANVFSFWEDSDLSGWILLGQYHEGSVLSKKLMKNQEVSHWQWLTVSPVVLQWHLFKKKNWSCKQFSTETVWENLKKSLLGRKHQLPSLRSLLLGRKSHWQLVELSPGFFKATIEDRSDRRLKSQQKLATKGGLIAGLSVKLNLIKLKGCSTSSVPIFKAWNTTCKSSTWMSWQTPVAEQQTWLCHSFETGTISHATGQWLKKHLQSRQSHFSEQWLLWVSCQMISWRLDGTTRLHFAPLSSKKMFNIQCEPVAHIDIHRPCKTK